jgi:hypothetical protein
VGLLEGRGISRPSRVMMRVTVCNNPCHLAKTPFLFLLCDDEVPAKSSEALA